MDKNFQVRVARTEDAAAVDALLEASYTTLMSADYPRNILEWPCRSWFVLWGDAGVPAATSGPLDVWPATFAPQATGRGIDSGHFLPEENPRATLAALIPFLVADQA